VKIVLARNEAYVAYGGKEISINSYEFLTGRGFKWVKSENGDTPKYAVSTGTTANGEPLYIGRVHYNDSLTVGKIQPSHNCCYIPYGGSEISAKSYEVLVQELQAGWVSFKRFYFGSQETMYPVEAGRDSNGATIWVGRVHYNGDVIPGKVVPANREAYIPYEGREVGIQLFGNHECEVRLSNNYYKSSIVKKKIQGTMWQ
jgi:Protein of unknown function (DUF3421)